MPVLVAKPKPAPKKDARKGVLYRPPPGLIESIDAAADELGLSRNEAMTQLLRFALEAHRGKSAKH